MPGILSTLSSFDAFSSLCLLNDFQFAYMTIELYKYGDTLTAACALIGTVFDFLFHLSHEANGYFGNVAAAPFLIISFSPLRFIYKDKFAVAWYVALTAVSWWLGSFTGTPKLGHPVRTDPGFVIAHGANHIVTTTTYTFYIWWLMKNNRKFGAENDKKKK